MASTSWNGLTGSWTEANNWSGGAVPDATTDVLITAPGDYTVTLAGPDTAAAKTVTFDASGATFDLSGTLTTNQVTVDATGATLNLFGTLTADQLTVTEGAVVIDGALQNTTIALAGGAVTFGDSAFASFSNVTWTGGALDLGAGSAELLVTNGLTVHGADAGAGTINLEGSFSNLDVTDAETLSNVTINVGSATGEDALTADGTLTLDTTTTTNLLAGADFAEISGLGTVINDGTINAAATDGIINATDFTNAGSLTVTANGTLSIQPSDAFTNTGAVTVDAGGFLQLANSATLTGGGSLTVFGTLDGGNQTLTLGTTGIANSLEIDGTIQNATIALAGGTTTFGDSAIANFTDITWTGAPLDLGAGSAELIVTNGLTVQGAAGAPGTINLEGSFSSLDVTDAETLSNVTINVGSATGDDALTADGTLTLDTTTTTNLLAGADFAEISGQGTVINDGTINAAATDGIINVTDFTNAGSLTIAANGTLSIQPSDTFTNTGAVTVDGGAMLQLANSATLTGGGALTVFGTLDGGNQTLTVGTTGIANSLEIDGTIQNATIALTNGTTTFGASAIASFNAVTWTGAPLDLGAGSAELIVTNGLTVQGAAGAPGTINLEGSFSSLDVTDAETLSNLTINVGSATGDDALTADGTLTLDTTTTTNLLASADFAEITGLGTVINDGAINAAATDGIINATDFTNAGSLTVTANGTLSIQPGDAFTNTGAVTVAAGGLLQLANTATLTGGGSLTVFGTLDGGNQTLTIGTTGIANSLEIDGTIQNATIALTNGTATFGDSAIANFTDVTWTGGPLDLGTGSAEIVVTNGLTVQGAAGAPGTPGTINLEGSFSSLDVTDTETLSNVTINIGSTTGDDALTADGTLTLDTTTTTKLLAGADFAEITGQGTVINDGTINAAATNGIINATDFTNAGSITVTAGTLAIQPSDAFTNINTGAVTVDAAATLDIQFLNTFTNTGTLTVDGGALSVGTAVAGAGTIALSNGATADLQNGATGGMVSFASATDTLTVDSTSFTDTLAGFDTAGTLDLTTVSFATGATATLAGTTLTLTDGATTEAFTLATTPADATKFFVYADANGGTEISSIPCYCPGTLIQTPGGERPIETLVIGDELTTATGETRPIIWIGRRGYDGRFAARNPDVLPILIRAGALADGIPRRDLMVSPLHAMFIDGVLIPAAALVNGLSITVVEDVERVDYIHLELDSHDIILAEGAPAESFIDDGSRGMFHNAAEYRSMHPDAVPTAAQYCAPRIEDGEELEAIRRHLEARAAHASQHSLGALHGHLDEVTPERVRGWARNLGAPGERVELRILDGHTVIGHVIAQDYRFDLQNAGFGDGFHGFLLSLPAALSPRQRHVIRVLRAADGQELEGSPFILDAQAAPVSLASAWQGQLDTATRTHIRGWAANADNPVQPVALQVLDNGVPVGRVIANRYRSDLHHAGLGTGRHGFELTLPDSLSPLGRHVVSVRFEHNGAELPGAPIVIEPANSFDAGLEETIANAISALAADGEQDRVLSFMAGQLQRLQQLQADIDGRRAEREAVTAAKQRALVIDIRLPQAARDAGSVAILSHIRALQRLGYEVSLVAPDAMKPQTDTTLADMGVRVWGAPYYGSVEDVLRRQAGCFDVVYLHRAPVATRYLALVRNHQPRARVLYSVADLHHVRLARQAALEDRPELAALSQQMRVAECTAAWSADAVLTHSTDEAALLHQAVPGADIHTVVWDVPLRKATPGFASRAGVAFIGGYAHAPNTDAAHHLVETVMPLVWAIDPAITCLLVGSDMPASVRALAQPGVQVLGQVEDLGALLDQVRLTVAPLRFGAGLKGKVVESLAAGVPCVMSPVAAEGLALPPALQALVGTDPAAMAAQIVRLHSKSSVHRQAVQAGRTLVRTRFTQDGVVAALQAAIEGRRQKLQAAQ